MLVPDPSRPGMPCHGSLLQLLPPAQNQKHPSRHWKSYRITHRWFKCCVGDKSLTSGQKLFSLRVPQQRQGASFLLGTRPEGLSPEARSQDLSAKAGSKGSSVIWKHKRRSTKCQGDDLRDMSLHNREPGLGKEAALDSETSHCALVTQALIKAFALVVLQVLPSICFSRW